VLDHRQHPTESLYLPHLGSTQGPALLAYNDGVFSDQDWEAVQTIYESSKTADTSCVYNISPDLTPCDAHCHTGKSENMESGSGRVTM
jgi:sacsin